MGGRVDVGLCVFLVVILRNFMVALSCSLRWLWLPTLLRRAVGADTARFQSSLPREESRNTTKDIGEINLSILYT